MRAMLAWAAMAGMNSNRAIGTSGAAALGRAAAQRRAPRGGIDRVWVAQYSSALPDMGGEDAAPAQHSREGGRFHVGCRGARRVDG